MPKLHPKPKVKYPTFALLGASKCPANGKHVIFIGMSDDLKAASCIKCGAWTDETPPDEFIAEVDLEDLW